MVRARSEISAQKIAAHLFIDKVKRAAPALAILRFERECAPCELGRVRKSGLLGVLPSLPPALPLAALRVQPFVRRSAARPRRRFEAIVCASRRRARAVTIAVGVGL